MFYWIICQETLPSALWLMELTVISRECESMMVEYVICLGMHVAVGKLIPISVPTFRTNWLFQQDLV